MVNPKCVEKETPPVEAKPKMEQEKKVAAGKLALWAALLIRFILRT